MKVRVARHTGYCFGVRRAMDLAFRRLESAPGPVYSHGPMIHNRQAMEILSQRGLKPWPEDLAELQGADLSQAVVVIRAHGLAPEAEEALRRAGVAVVDATCPRVAEVQRLVAREAAQGANVIIWGAAGHPEVEGLLGYAAGRGWVLGSAAEAGNLPDFGLAADSGDQLGPGLASKAAIAPGLGSSAEVGAQKGSGLASEARAQPGSGLVSEAGAQPGLELVFEAGAKRQPDLASEAGAMPDLSGAAAGDPKLRRVILVAQTTQNLDLWPEVVAAVKARFPEARAVNTICQATVNRQNEARRLASECQALVVVGDRHSGNTRRLFEIGRSRGLKTISVEGPDEIDPSFVKGVSVVGLVSGASTPKWQSRLVRQKLTSLGRASLNTPRSFAIRLTRALVLSNIHVGLGAGFLGWAMAMVMGYRLPGFFFGLFFFFCQAMHLMNGYLDLNSVRYNDLDRAEFLAKYRPYLVGMGLGSLALSLSAAWLAGPLALGLIASLSCLAFLYAVPWPVTPLGRWGVRRLKDVPLSKSLATASGWSLVLVVPALVSNPPVMELDRASGEMAAWAFAAIFCQVFARSLRMDFQDSLGDSIFGFRTAVTMLGWRWATRFLKAALAAWAILLIAASVRHPGSPFPFLLVSGPIYNLIFVPGLIKNFDLEGFAFDFLLDSQFLLAALMVLLWTFS